MTEFEPNNSAEKFEQLSRDVILFVNWLYYYLTYKNEFGSNNGFENSFPEFKESSENAASFARHMLSAEAIIDSLKEELHCEIGLTNSLTNKPFKRIEAIQGRPYLIADFENELIEIKVIWSIEKQKPLTFMVNIKDNFAAQEIVVFLPFSQKMESKDEVLNHLDLRDMFTASFFNDDRFQLTLTGKVEKFPVEFKLMAGLYQPVAFIDDEENFFIYVGPRDNINEKKERNFQLASAGNSI